MEQIIPINGVIAVITVLIITVLAICLYTVRQDLGKAKRELKDYENLMQSGEFMLTKERYSTHFAVVARSKTCWYTKKMVIKTFPYEDAEGYDYASLCADELKEKLEEKI